MVSRRYSEFEELHKKVASSCLYINVHKLGSIATGLPPFPEKTVMKIGGSVDSVVLEQRQQMFTAYLEALRKCPLAMESHTLRSFLDFTIEVTFLGYQHFNLIITGEAINILENDKSFANTCTNSSWAV